MLWTSCWRSLRHRESDGIEHHLDAMSRDAFLQEASVMFTLSNVDRSSLGTQAAQGAQHIPKIYGVGVEWDLSGLVASLPPGPTYFIVMEKLEVTVAACFLHNVPRHSVFELLRVAHDVALSLAFLGSLGLCHGDLKPGNVMLDAKGRAVLCDFGVGATTLTYAAPELSRRRLSDSSMTIRTPPNERSYSVGFDIECQSPASDM